MRKGFTFGAAGAAIRASVRVCQGAAVETTERGGRGRACEEPSGSDEEGITMLARKDGKGRIDLVARAGVKDLDLVSVIETLAGLTSTATRTAFGTNPCAGCACVSRLHGRYATRGPNGGIDRFPPKGAASRIETGSVASGSVIDPA
jgi:hypothetical protein